MANTLGRRLAVWSWIALSVCAGRAENLLPGDSGYEAGFGYFSLPWAESETAMTLEEGDAAEGAQCASFRLDAGRQAGFSGPELRLTAGQSYTVSFWARADRADLPATLTLVHTGWQQTEAFPLTLTTQWQRYQVVIQPRFDVYWLLLGAQNPGSDSVEIRLDACQLEPGTTAGEFVSGAALRTGLVCEGGSTGIFFPDEPVRFRVLAVDHRAATPEALTVEVTVSDFLGRPVAERRWEVAWEGAVYRNRTTWDEVDGCGLFTVRSGWRDAAGRLVAADVATFAVIPPPLVRDPGVPPFAGINGGLPPGGEKLGVGWTECCVLWQNLQPEQDRYDFSFLTGVKERKRNGKYTKVSLIHQPSTPEWARDPAEAAAAAQAGLNPGKNLLPATDKLADFTAMWTALIREADGCIDVVELGGEDDLIIGNDSFYRQKYPDQVHDGYVCGEVSTRIGRLTRAAIAGIRAADPTVKIAVNRVSGEDCYQRDFNFSRGVLAELNGDFDYFSMDAYCRRLRYIDTENTWIGLPDWDFPEVFERARGLTAALGRRQEPFISEYGFAIDVGLEPDHRLQLEMAKRAARALLLARALETPCFFWYSAQQSVEAGKYDYGMWRNGQPTMVVPAFAMALQAVENVRATRLDQRYDNLRCVWFDQGDRAVLAFWNVIGNGRLRLELPDGTVCFDLMGNRLPLPTNGTLESSDQPRYLVLEGAAAAPDLLRALESVQDLSFPLRSSLSLRSLNECGIAVGNPGSYRGATECVYALNRGVKNRVSHEFEPETGWFVPVPPLSQWRRLDYTLRCANGGERAWSWQPELQPWPTDGPVVTLADRRNIFPPDPHIRWSGPEDLSVTVSGGVDAETIRVAVTVRDDHHYNRRFGAESWNGDALQLAFHPTVLLRDDGDGGDDGGGYGDGDVELILALQTDGMAATVTHGKLPELTPGRDFAVERDAAAGVTRYRLELPRAALGLTEAGRIFGFNLVVFDDDDGAGQSYYCRLAGGITGAKNPNAFPLFYLQ